MGLRRRKRQPAISHLREDPGALSRKPSPGTLRGPSPLSTRPTRRGRLRPATLCAEGGIRCPLVVAGAGVRREGGFIHDGLVHVMDIAPTLLELAGVTPPAEHQGRPVQRMQGKSWVATLAGEAAAPRGPEDWLGWELWGSRAIRRGNWKLLWQPRPMGDERWALYDLGRDPGERRDLAQEEPEKVQQLAALWEEYARTNNVILPSRTPFETLEDALPPRVPVDEGFPPLKFKKPFAPPEVPAQEGKE